MRSGFLTIIFIFSLIGLSAQNYELKSTTEIYGDLQKLHKGMRVLYLAAHPDDENTRLISWLENAQHIETAYLSLTRGQGGQNLIGDEKGDALGVIRTYELLEARKIDGGDQFFTRAVDFGYSKSARESFEIWGREEVLADVVYVIRKFRPHIIVTRFPASEYAGHGHHEASAILAEEAFDLAADQEAFNEQLTEVGTWQTQALYFNASSWWDKSLDQKTDEELKAEKMHKVNIGEFSEIRGMGINEIASLARSMHRCQAFGTNRDRGEQFEYLKLVKGEWNDDFPNGYPGIWKLSPPHQDALAKVIKGFDFTDRSANLKLLQQEFAPRLAQRNMWAEGMDLQYVMNAYQQLQLDLMGIRAEVWADGPQPIVAGSEYPVYVEVYNSGDQLAKVTFDHPRIDTSFDIAPGKRVDFQRSFKAPDEFSTPYWLRKPHGTLYTVEDMKLFGLPKLEDEQITFRIRYENSNLTANTVLHRKWRDRSVGELTEPMAFVPYASITPLTKSLIVRQGDKAKFKVGLKAYEAFENHTLSVQVPEGWTINQAKNTISLGANQEMELEFEIEPKKDTKPGSLSFSLEGNGKSSNQMAQWIKYEHIPEQVIHSESQVELNPIDMPKATGRILYVEGSGDEVDDALLLMGYEVDKTPLSKLSQEDLEAYKAVIIGIRALNRNEELPAYYSKLLTYAENGGNLIVQYNTTYGLQIENFAPYTIELSRNRVTEEDAEAKLLKPDHPVFTTPNKITDKDFEGWVQERGLYFAGKWDETNFTPLIAWHDRDEEDQKGGLLVAKTGKGSFFYTGISFFRELPAGVPGAYRLLMNIIEYQP